ncbi:MAG TPA: hypothetical protein VH458_12690 [Vicinamibacterales bacterium]|jgi:hypothetical protein
MRRTHRLTAALVIFTFTLLFIALPVAKAEALTVRDVVELSKAGLSDQVLLALIEVDHTVFTIDTPTLKMLKEAGVSEAVIIAMIRSGREVVQIPADQSVETPPQPAEPPQPPPIVMEQPEPVVREVPVPVPVAVPVAVPVFVTTTIPSRVHNGPGTRPVDDRTAHPHCVKPEYWGFGGKLRPDAYAPPNVCR